MRSVNASLTARLAAKVAGRRVVHRLANRTLAPVAAATRVGDAILLDRAARKARSRFARERSRRPQFLEEDRPGEIITLRVADLGCGLQVGQLLERFDALRDHGHAERFAQRLDRPQDALAAWALVNVRDERAVDLDLVGG